MDQTFRLTRAEVEDADPAALKASILSATGSESGADSIMRSLARMSGDPSIDYFEMTQVSGTRRYGGAATASWRVRADRGLPAEETSPLG